MKKASFKAYVSTAIISYLFWLVLTGQIIDIFRNKASIEVLIAGAIVAILVSAFTARFFIHERAFAFLNPIKFVTLIVYCFVIFMIELIKANVNVALKAFSPKLNIKPGVVRIPVNLTDEYALSMLANSITLTPGTITVDTVEDEDGKNYFYIHWLDVDTTDGEKAGEEIKGTLEKWIRRLF